MKQLNQPVIPMTAPEGVSLRRVLAMSVYEFDWPARIENVFKEHHIHTFDDLVQHSEFKLRCYHNIGKLSVNYIKECLENLNLHLGMRKCPHCNEFLDLPKEELPIHGIEP